MLAPPSNAYTHILKPKTDICGSKNKTNEHAYITTLQGKKITEYDVIVIYKGVC